MVCAGNRRGNHAAALNTTKSVFSSNVGLVRPKTRDKWLKVSHDTGSALIHDGIVQ